MRSREEIIEDILDRIDQIWNEAYPENEQQAKQEFYIIPATPLDEIMLLLLPELDALDEERRG